MYSASSCSDAARFVLRVVLGHECLATPLICLDRPLLEIELHNAEERSFWEMCAHFLRLKQVISFLLGCIVQLTLQMAIDSCTHNYWACMHVNMTLTHDVADLVRQQLWMYLSSLHALATRMFKTTPGKITYQFWVTKKQYNSTSSTKPSVWNKELETSFPTFI